MEYITDWRILEERVRQCIGQGSWPDLCKLIGSASEDAIVGLEVFLEALEHERIKGSPEYANTMRSYRVRTLAAAATNLIVEYNFDEELYNELLKSASLDRELTISNILRLPYTCFSLNLKGEPEWKYILIFKDQDNIIVSTVSGVTVFEGDVKMGDLYDDCRTEKDTAFQTAFIKMIAYITNNKDVVERNDIIELPNGEPSKKRKKKSKKIRHITATVGNIFNRSMQRWKEAQETEYQNDPELRGKQRPHCRGGHHQIYWVGKGRMEARLVFVHPYDVNVDKPQDMEIHYKVK